MVRMRVLGFFSLIIFIFSAHAHADGSFRLANGNLISEGQSKSELIAIAGPPIYQDVETIAVDQGVGGKPIKREILTYQLAGSIGGKYLVVITVDNNLVVAIEATQESRLRK